MAAGSKPHEHLGCLGNEVHHPVGSVPGLEFWCGTRGAAGHDGRPANNDLVAQPAQSSGGPILFAAFAKHLTTKRLWRGQQRCQHATIQQPRLLQPWGWRRRPFLRRPPAIALNH